MDKANFIFDKWKAGIRKEDRRHEALPAVFDLLFAELSVNNVDFDVAHELAKLATKHMYPSKIIVAKVYDKSHYKKLMSENEFFSDWKSNVDTVGMSSFYSYFKMDGLEAVSVNDMPDKICDNTQRIPDNEDSLNAEEFWKKTTLVTKENPWFYHKD